MIDEKNFFDQPVKSDMRIVYTIPKLQQVKEMITQMAVCWIVIISIKTLK